MNRRTLQPMPPQPSFDHEAALAACARGERFALRSLYEHESRWLLGVASRIVRDRQTAEDVLQDAFLQVWNGAASFDPRLGSARGWIYTVVRHRALNALRSAGREVALDDETLQAVADANDAREASHAAAAHDDRGVDADAIERCLERLDEQKRRCILLAFVDGYTHGQIAARLGAPLGTVKSAIRRGLLSLKECLS